MAASGPFQKCENTNDYFLDTNSRLGDAPVEQLLKAMLNVLHLERRG